MVLGKREGPLRSQWICGSPTASPTGREAVSFFQRSIGTSVVGDNLVSVCGIRHDEHRSWTCMILSMAASRQSCGNHQHNNEQRANCLDHLYSSLNSFVD